MDSELPSFLVWSLCISAWCIMRYTVYPGLVSCPFYAIPIYPFKFMKFFIYLSPFIFLLLLAVRVIERNNNFLCSLHPSIIGASVSEPHLRTCLSVYIPRTSVILVPRRPPHYAQKRAPLSVCLSIYLVRQSFWSRGGPRTTRKRKPAHLEFKGDMR